MPSVKSGSYETMKLALLDAFDLMQAQRAAKLLHLKGLGDKLPSVLASEIVALVPSGNTLDYLERQIFLEQLPGAVQQNMAAHEKKMDFMKLAKIANGCVIAAQVRVSGVSCAVTVPQSSSDTQSQIRHQPVPQMVNDSAGEQDSAPCYAVGGRGQSSTVRKLCFYHQRFGVAAHKCGGSGCTWKNWQGNGNTSCH